MIVVEDASTDRTASIAAQFDARILHVVHRQIAATRNAGARAARGNTFFFVDACTLERFSQPSSAPSRFRS